MVGQKGKGQQISWLVEFVQADLKKLSRGDLVKLAVELSSLISDRLPYLTDLPPLLEDVTLLSGNVPVVSQKGMSDKRTSDTTRSTFDLKGLDCQTFLNRGQKALRGFLEAVLAGIERTETALSEIRRYTETDVDHILALHSFEMPRLGITLRGTFAPCKIGETAELIITPRFESDTLEETMVFNAARLLEDVPVNVFHKCPECQKWFAHFNKREKRFCSNQCAARHGVRKSRAELKNGNPDKYEEELKAGATRARKSYEKHIERGKPERRPYKHK